MKSMIFPKIAWKNMVSREMESRKNAFFFRIVLPQFCIDSDFACVHVNKLFINNVFCSKNGSFNNKKFN